MSLASGRAGPEPEPSPNRLETVAIAYSQAEIAVLYAFLEGHGIWTSLHSQPIVSVQWGATLALGGVQVRVHSEDAPAARTFLAEIEQKPFTGRIFTGHRLLDLLLAVMLLLACGAAPPARVPAFFLLNGRSAGPRES